MMQDPSIRRRRIFRQVVFIALAVGCLMPFARPPLALLAGFVFALVWGNPFEKFTPRATKLLLQFSVVGLGFGMNLFDAAHVGGDALIFTAASICVTLLAGILAGRLLSVGKKTSLLISAGTAICGGSAIAAMAPVVDADENEMSVSLGTVFILNSVALFVFPLVGRHVGLDEHRFGLWAAMAIHDTSSVVGAAQRYGPTALQVATTVKLERALWIIPVVLGTALFYKKQKSRIKPPYFILGFVLAMALVTFVPEVKPVGDVLVAAAKKGLTLTLFFIGAGLTRKSLKNVGVRPLVLGLLLWVFISVSTLLVIMGM